MFNGASYIPRLDKVRLGNQIRRIYDCMKDGRYRTLSEIQTITGDGEASISAQLRHLRKKRFGSYIILKRRRGDGRQGLFEYQLSIGQFKLEL